jgi:hypothetical protein|tara:strand:- start:894 stop:1208 length:315 start_codon:yes stop_codon:yes gene_type:complete
MSESALLREVMKRVGAMPGAHPMRRNSGKRRSRSPNGCETGTPDIEVMLRDMRVVWLELKVDKGKPSPEQLEWHAMARAMGHRVYVCRSVQEAVDAVQEVQDAD